MGFLSVLGSWFPALLDPDTKALPAVLYNYGWLAGTACSPWRSYSSSRLALLPAGWGLFRLIVEQLIHFLGSPGCHRQVGASGRTSPPGALAEAEVGLTPGGFSHHAFPAVLLHALGCEWSRPKWRHGSSLMVASVHGLSDLSACWMGKSAEMPHRFRTRCPALGWSNSVRFWWRMAATSCWNKLAFLLNSVPNLGLNQLQKEHTVWPVSCWEKLVTRA